MKTGYFFLITALFLMLPLVSAINLEIKKEAVSDVVISEINEPAIFNFFIKNLGSTENFEIYSLVGVDFSPKGTFPVLGGETKEIEVRVYPDISMKKMSGAINFNYKIRGQDSGIMDDSMQLFIASFKDALNIGSESVYPDSRTAIVYIENRYSHDFPKIIAEFESAFFSEKETFSLKPLEKKEFNITINRGKLIGLIAGSYPISAKLEAGGADEEFRGTITYAEKQGIVTSERSSGLIFRENVIEKLNEGNIRVLAEISIKKNIVSRLFTKFNSAPSFVERNGLGVYYTWNKEIAPGETLIVKANTNYAYPLVLLIAVILAAYLTFVYSSSNLTIKKSAHFVRAKGGEFALKITLTVSSSKYTENISITDRFPGITKLYEKFGIYPPSRIDEKNRKIEWHIERLHPKEERVFSYIIYSKMGVVGRLELSPAVVVYEREGKRFETSSNRAFFMNETRSSDYN